MKKENGKLVKNVHTLNNLLTTIHLSAEMMLKELYGPLTRPQKTEIKSLLVELKKINALVKKMGKKQN
ncbi:MAG: hypothetical protein ACHQVK_00280 [Candidatus Paceibacterales bacterium]